MILRRAAPLLLLASVVAAAAPHLGESANRLRRMVSVPRAKHAVELNGSWIRDLAAIRPQLDDAGEVFIVAAREDDIGAAALASASLFPLPTHLYVGADAFISDTARRNLQPRAIVWANRASGRELRLAPFSDVVARELDSALAARIDSMAVTATAMSGTFMIPLAVSARGAGHDAYATSLQLSNRSPVPVDIALTLHSSAEREAPVRTLRLQPDESLRARDLTRELFDQTETTGWLAVRSSGEVLVAAALVNRGRAQVDAMRAIAPACGTQLLEKQVHDATALKLWVVNTSDKPSAVTWIVNGDAGTTQRTELGPHAAQQVSNAAGSSCSACSLAIATDPPCSVAAFLSEKQHSTGATAFAWPEGAKQ